MGAEGGSQRAAAVLVFISFFCRSVHWEPAPLQSEVPGSYYPLIEIENQAPTWGYNTAGIHHTRIFLYLSTLPPFFGKSQSFFTAITPITLLYGLLRHPITPFV